MYVAGVSFFRESPIVFQVKPSKPGLNVTPNGETIHDNLEHGSYEIYKSYSNSLPAAAEIVTCRNMCDVFSNHFGVSQFRFFSGSVTPPYGGCVWRLQQDKWLCTILLRAQRVQAKS